jgi:glycosyltransferase involved in cell wall biosynthesis
LLYLGFAFPPGVQTSFSGINPAGHIFETEMIAALRVFYDIKSVGLLPREAARAAAKPDDSSGINHDLILVDFKPEIAARWHAASQLAAWHDSTISAGWTPSAILSYNLSPVYNHFIGRLHKRGHRSKRVLLLADSSSLGQAISAWKRFRHRFKPMRVSDDQAIKNFDAGIGLSPETKKFFGDQPWMWMPGGCSGKAVQQAPRADGPIRFAYFGALAAHSGIMELIDCFLRLDSANTLDICGYGKLRDEIALRAGQQPRLRFAGQLPSTADCLNFAAAADVLINPRPGTHGNENNFPSKLFQYALTGRSILTSRLSGTAEVLGPAAFYFDERDFSSSLSEALRYLSTFSRSELHARGLSIQQRVMTEYTWSRQAERIAGFIDSLL